MDKECNRCKVDLVLVPDLSSSGMELLCPKCGSVANLMENNFELMKFGRSPESSLVYNGGKGTNYATRNPDGSSDSYAMKGNNGKYEAPVTTMIQRWDLLATIEPDYEIRSLRERLSSIGKQNGFKDEHLHRLGQPIMAQTMIAKRAKNHRFIGSDDDIDFTEGSRLSSSKFVRCWVMSALAQKRGK